MWYLNTVNAKTKYIRRSFFYQHRLCFGFLFLKCRQKGKNQKMHFFFCFTTVQMCVLYWRGGKCDCSRLHGNCGTRSCLMCQQDRRSHVTAHSSHYSLTPTKYHSLDLGDRWRVHVHVCVCLGTCIFAEWYQSHVLLMTRCTLETEDDNHQSFYYTALLIWLISYFCWCSYLRGCLFTSIFIFFNVFFLWWLSIKILFF